jgi:hypothetical protein
MVDPQIEANIVEVDDGRYFPVRLHTIPAVGDLIDLWSFIDQKAGHSPRRLYEVVAVVHGLYDVPEDAKPERRGGHLVTVYAKPSSSKFFENSGS